MAIKSKFDFMQLPDLDETAVSALRLFLDRGVPKLNLGNYGRPLVVGSGNAANTGRILFHDKDAVFADESGFREKIKDIPDIDGAVLISASGSKHAPGIAKFLKQKKIDVLLLTCTPDSPAAHYLPSDRVFVFPKNTEPYTYNTSTYMGMILGKTCEDPAKLLDFIRKDVDTALKNTDLGRFHSFFLILPSRFDAMKEMLVIKFDELFGPKVSKRVYTAEQARHAKTVVPSSTELFISFGEKNTVFGEKKQRLHIPLPQKADFGAMMAIGYYVIGKIQKSNPPWFKQNIESYCKKTSKDFGSKINPIVD